MESNRLSWADYAQRYEEASDLQNDLETDVANIESGSASPALQAWDDLSADIYQNASWQDLLQGKNGQNVKAHISNITNAAENYMMNETIQVQRPNAPAGQYIDLYAVTGDPVQNDDQQYGNKYAETTTEVIDDVTYIVAVPANFFEMITGKYAELANDPGDAYFFSPNWQQWQQHMGNTPWAQGGLNYDISMDDSGTGGGDAIAYGSLSQWAPFIHLSGGDPSALNAALQG